MIVNSEPSNIKEQCLQEPKLEAVKKADTLAVKPPAAGFTHRSYNLSSF